MSSHYCLQVIRLENLRWRHPLHSSVPDLYVEVTLVDITRRTATIERSTSPVWDEPLVFPCDSQADGTAIFSIHAKHRSAWSSNLCVGSIGITAADLLRRCASGKVSLELSAPKNKGATSVGRIVMLLSVIDAVEAAEINLDGIPEDVRRSKVMRLEGALDVTQSMDNSVAQIGGQRDLYRAFGKLLSRFDVVRQVLDQLSEIHPFITITWKLISGLCMAAKGVFDTDKRVINLVHSIVDAFAFVQDVQVLPDKSVSFQQMIVELLKQTIECCLFIRHYVKRTFFRRMLDVTSSQKVDEFERSLGSLKQGIESGVNLSTAFVSMQSSRRVDNLVLSQRLNPTLSDTFDRPVCLPETRVAVRTQIMEWIFSETKQNVFWLHGVAGSGKSTISMTIMEHLREMSRLGAYMFFEREKSQPSSVIRSIAYQLAVFDSSIESAILSETDNDSAISTASPSRQFDKLILHPLRSTADSIPGPIVIALDAFDECGNPKSRHSLMELIRKDFPKLPCTFRFLVTSRGEDDIDKFLSSQPENVLAMELDYSSPISQDDVHTYIRTEMHNAVREVVEVPSEWPWDENMASLGKAAGGLFVWASTAVKMVKNSDNPFAQLDCITTDSRSLAGLGLDQLYSAVLRGSGIVWENYKSRERFVKVMSVLLLSKVPLTSKTIDRLLGFPPQETSLLILSRLRSVLTYIPGGPVNLFHASFADYLMSAEHSEEPWFIDTFAPKQHIVDRCFTVMKDLLRFNICDVKTSFARTEDDPGLAGRIDARIPLHLEYACLYWPQHLTEIDCSPGCVGQLSDFVYQRLLFWFELLSLKRHFGRIAVRALLDVASWIGRQDANISSFLQDASRLASIFTMPIVESVPHIYISMLPLLQDESRVSAHYSKFLRSAVKIDRDGVKRHSVYLKVLARHSNMVTSVSISSDGRRIASASWDGTVRVWDFDSGEETLQPRIRHSNHVWSVSFFHDSRRIVSGGDDGTVVVWDAENGDVVLGPLKGHTSYIRAVAVSPDGTMIASGSNDKTIIIRDTSDGRILSRLTGHTDDVTSVSFSPHSTRLVSGSHDQTMRIWNVNNGELALAPLVQAGKVFSVAFSPDGRYVVSGSDQEVTIWDSQAGNIISVLEGHTDCVMSVGYSPCGTRIVSGSQDRTLIVWDAVSGEIVSGPLEGHSYAISCVTFSPNGQYIISSSDDHTVRVWDVTTRSAMPGKQERHTSSVKSVALSADGSRIASASVDCSILIWDALRGDVIVGPLLGHSNWVSCVAFTPNGSRLISGSLDSTIMIWDVDSAAELVLGPLEGHMDAVLCIAVSPDGNKVVSGSRDNEIRVWDVATGMLIAGPLHSHSGSVNSLAYSPDGTRLASCSDDETVIIWDTSAWVAITEPLRGHASWVVCVCFSPDGQLLASCSWDESMLVWDVMSGQVMGRHFEARQGPIYPIVFLLDGLHIVLGSWDGRIRVWNLESNQIVCTLRGHSEPVTSLALSTDGTQLVSGSQDNIVRLWDVSDLGKHGETDLAASLLSHREDVWDSDWVLDNEGWIRSGRDQCKLLLWIPPDLRRTLWCPRNTLILSCEFSTKIDFTGVAIGERWSECLKLVKEE